LQNNQEGPVMSAKRYSILMLFIALSFGFILSESRQSKGEDSKQATAEEIINQAMPTLRINGERDLKLEKLAVDIKIVGQIATTTMDMTFYNDENKVIEGELNFPLADGQSISRYALQIGDNLREGVVVEKEKGRKVFESIVRRRVDPGLLEKTKGNNFRTRIYPIPAKGTRRVVIAYEHELKAGENGLRYILPMNYQQEIDNFSLNTVVFNSDEAPVLGKNILDGFKFEEDDEGYAAKLNMSDYLAQKDLSFTVPYPKQRNSVFIEELDGEIYFYANIRLDGEKAQKRMPKKLAVYWDVSSSGGKRDIKSEKKLLARYIEKIGYGEVTLIPFNIWQEKKQEFDIKGGKSVDLMNAINNLIYDGATQLGELNLGEGNFDEILLFSDGLSNFGRKYAAMGNLPVIPINSSQSADHAYLKYLAAESGGRYINLVGSSMDDAFEQMTSDGLALLSVNYMKSQADEIYPKVKTYTENGVTIAGKLTSYSTKIKLNFGYGNYSSFSEEIEVNRDDAISSSGLVARLWANKKISELSMLAEKNKDAITELGKKYSIVTDNTSLIVLETALDYYRYEVDPPEEMKEEVAKIIKQNSKYKRNYDKDSLALVSTKYSKSSIAKWYKTDFEELERERLESKRIQDSINLAIIAKRDSINELYNIDTSMSLPIMDQPSSGGIYGSLKGMIIDENGDPIAGATIKILGTRKGAYSKSDGKFTITGINPGDWDTKVTFVGKQEFGGKIRIEAGRTTIFDALLYSSEVTTDVVYVMCASSDMVDKGAIGSSQGFIREEMESTVGSSVSATVGLSAGVINTSGGYSIRGARSNETQIRVDGLDVGNQFTGGAGVFGSGEYAEAESADLPEAVRLGKTRDDKMEINEYFRQQAREYDSEEYAEKVRESDDYYLAYLLKKPNFNDNPEFYYDTYDLLIESGQKKKALLAISNLVEMRLEDHELARTIAYRLMELGEYELAELSLEEVLKIRGEEPQSYRDLALAKIETGKYQEAADLFFHVLSHNWDRRFSTINYVVIKELSNLAIQKGDQIDCSKFEELLIDTLQLDLRIVLTWDKDNCDIDLHVTDPNQEQCFFQHRQTKQGGLMSYDLTGGYGPEDFVLRDAIPGEYIVEGKFFSKRIQRKHSPIFVQATVYRNYGKPNQTKEVHTLKLKNPRDKEHICTITID
jgi:hypothetical protein